MSSYRSRTKTRAIAVAGLAAIAAATSSVHAGGYLGLNGTNPHRWPAGAITLRFDQGTLGSLSNASADAMATAGVNVWANGSLSTCSLTFTIGTDLPVDNNGGSAPQLNAPADGINPIIYDTDGAITDLTLGSGANDFVLGFAGIVSTTGSTINEGRAVMNGLFIDGAGSPADVSSIAYQGVFSHEFGHFLNMDHAQFNDGFAKDYTTAGTANFTNYPIMYPLVIDDPEMATLAFDDQCWISDLYPSASFANLTTISGTSNNFAGTAVSGVNMVARRVDGSVTQAVSCVSGFTGTTGTYKFPGLPVGSSWVIDFEEVSQAFTGGSGVGITDPPLVLPAPPEYVNEPAAEGAADSVVRSTTFVTGAAGSNLSGINLRFNGAPALNNVTEVDGGRNPFSGSQTITLTPGTNTVISGTANSTETGTGQIDFIGDPIEDWYIINTTNQSGVELHSAFLDMPAGLDFDLYVMVRDGGNLFVPAIGLNAGAGADEDVLVGMDTSLVTGSGFANQIFIGVSSFSGTGAYTLTLKGAPSDNDMCVVGGVAVSPIDPGTGTVTVNGRGFKNNGGAPVVTFSDPQIVPGVVTFINANQVQVAVTQGGSFSPGTTDVSVVNNGASGGYGGKRTAMTTVPVELSAFSLE